MGGSRGSLVVCISAILLVLVGTAQSQPVGAPAVNPVFAPAPAPGVKTPVSPTPVTTSAPVSGPPSYLAINCGGLTPPNASLPQYYGGVTYGHGDGTFYQPNNTYVSTTAQGNGDVVFLSDRYYYGTSTKPKEYLGFAPLSGNDGALYLTERYGLSFSYEFDLPNGNYNVDLHFAELQFNNVGARVFSVMMQGVTTVDKLDIFAQVGANRSLIVTKPAVVSNGLLSIYFFTVSSNQNEGEAKVNAIRVYNPNLSNNVPFPAPPNAYFIDVGSSFDHVAADRVNYTKDSFVSGGVPVAFTNGAGAPSPLSVARTADPIVYSTARVGSTFSYYFNLPVGHYRVDLDFVEGQFTQPGQRLFTVQIQGVQAFPQIDIIANSTYALSPAAAPAPSAVLYTPTSFNLTSAAAVSNGLLRIDFNGTNGSNATVSAIKVTPLRNPTMAALAIDCGSPIDVVSGNGVIFQSDRNYSTPSYAIETNPYQVFLPYNDAVDDFLYPTVRAGNFTYNFTMPNGAYLITLFFADLNATGPGQRIFDVFVQEVKVLAHLDVYAQTGGAITAYIFQVPVNVTGGFVSVRFQSSPDALSLPGVQPQSYTSGGQQYTNTLYPPFVSAIYVEPGVVPGSVMYNPSPAKVRAQAPMPIGPPPPPGAPDPYFAYVYTPADEPLPPVPPVPTYGGSATTNPYCPANGAPPQAINCTGPCPLWTPPFGLNVAVNAAGPRFVSSCGIVFEDDSSNSTRCAEGDAIPAGARWCRTNIKGPQGGYQYSTSEGIFNTSDPTVFQSEFIGYNTYKFRLPSPGIYYAYSYFAEISGTDPVIDVNRPGLRVFYIHFNGNNADAIGPIDPFVDAGEQKFSAVAATGRGVTCSTNELSIQYEAVASGRDAPAIKGIWVYGPVDSNFNALAPLGAQSPTSGSNTISAPPPPVSVTPPSSVAASPPTQSATQNGAPTPAPTPSGS